MLCEALCRTRTDDPFLTMEGGLSDRDRKPVTLTKRRAHFGQQRTLSDGPNTPKRHPRAFRTAADLALAVAVIVGAVFSVAYPCLWVECVLFVIGVGGAAACH
jgi:hypothetical protein